MSTIAAPPRQVEMRAHRGHLRFVACSLLALAGQLAALSLIDAGPGVRYQHYAITSAAGARDHWPALLFIAVQGALVVAAGRDLWRRALRWLYAHRSVRFAAAAAVFVLASAVPSRDAGSYVIEVLAASAIQLVMLATVLLALHALPGTSWLSRAADRLLGEPEAAPGLSDRFAWSLALAVVAVTALLAVSVYQRHPHVPDEVAYLLHARYFAHGMLTMPAPPVPEAFDLDLMRFEAGRWYSPVTPGWPAVLALGFWLRAPWLVNPLLSGVCVLLGYGFLRELHDRRTARMATLLLATSPWLLFLGMSFMPHAATLAFALAAALAIARLRRSGTTAWAWLAGLGIGVVALIRPLEGLVLAGLLGLWTLPVRGRVFRLAPALALVLATALTVLPVLFYNQAITGAPLTFPIDRYSDALYGPGSNSLGFGANRGVGWGIDPFPGHGLRDVVVNTALNTAALNTELFGWATGSLWLLLLWFAAGRTEKRDRVHVWALLAIPAVHALYWFSGGPDFGPRYWYLMIVPGVILTVRGGQALEVATGLRMKEGLLLLAAIGLLTFVPWRASDKYSGYRSMRPGVRALAADARLEGGLVLIQGRRHPDFASAAVYNPMDPTSTAPIFVWDRDAETRRRLRAAYPDRPVWLVAGPTQSGAGYRLRGGPYPWSRVPVE